MKKLASLLLASALAIASASAVTEQEIVDRSAEIMRGFRAMPEKAIPRRVLDDARGLAIMSVLKVGFGLSGQGGQGVVVARTGHGWSGPSFIGTGGAGWGLQIGAQITEFVFVLNTDAAVRSFSRGGNVTIGGDVSATAGPVGRDLQAGVTPSAAIYTYSRSQGLFAGISLQGAVIATQKTANARYYRHTVSARQILSGHVSPPAGTSVLLRALGR
jgi:lipid-binding SYLF domain-containing protein